MTGDGKIGLQVGNVVRLGAVRKLASATTEEKPAATPRPTQDVAASASLITLAADIAKQPVPVDHGRVAAIREAIASGSYRLDPAATALAMLQFHAGGADA